MTGPRVDVLGCGRAARVVLRWLMAARQIEIGQVCNRSLSSASAAVEFIGAGQVVESLSPAEAGDWLLLGLPDGQLESAAAVLADCGYRPGAVALHLSGAVSSTVLAPLGSAAAVHPLRAFADPAAALVRMPGTWCLAEGESEAVAALSPRFTAAGARWAPLATAAKGLYHAATVVASNYQVTLTALARALAASAGLDAATAAALIEDLQRDSLDRLSADSPAAALTGPIERGDDDAVARQLAAVDAAAGASDAALFRRLGLATLALARQGRGERPGDARIEALFTSRSD